MAESAAPLSDVMEETLSYIGDEWVYYDPLARNTIEALVRRGLVETRPDAYQVRRLREDERG